MVQRARGIDRGWCGRRGPLQGWAWSARRLREDSMIGFLEKFPTGLLVQNFACLHRSQSMARSGRLKISRVRTSHTVEQYQCAAEFWRLAPSAALAPAHEPLS